MTLRRPIGYDVELVRIMPFLYRWEREPKESIFRVTIGNEKYYVTIQNPLLKMIFGFPFNASRTAVNALTPCLRAVPI